MSSFGSHPASVNQAIDDVERLEYEAVLADYPLLR